MEITSAVIVEAVAVNRRMRVREARKWMGKGRYELVVRKEKVCNREKKGMVSYLGEREEKGSQNCSKRKVNVGGPPPAERRSTCKSAPDYGTEYCS